MPRRPWLQALVRTRVIALAAMVALAVALSLAPSAGASMRVDSTAKDGLVITDQNNTFDDRLFLKLFSTSTGLKWEVFKTGICGPTCVDLVRFTIGSGCRSTRPGTATADVHCDRLSNRVTLNLGGGNDHFTYREDTLPVTDSVVINAGAGNDIGSGNAGEDTINGGSGNDVVGGNEANDVVSGGTGNDTVSGDDGADTLSGGDGNDALSLGTGADTAEGGSGDDRFGLGTSVRDEKDEVNGGLGGDKASYTSTFGGRLTELRIIEANLETIAGDKDEPEGDILRSIESYRGGRDEDIITGAFSSNSSDYFGEGDDDTIFGSSAANTLVGGAGGDRLDGNAGNDVIDGKAGEGSTADADPLIDCGTGSLDLAIIDLTDDQSPAGCENIDRSPAREGPHVRIRVPRRIRVAGGRAAFRLTCPRKPRRRCAGTLHTRLGKASTERTRYSIRAGRSRRVQVTLGSLERRVGRRTVARLVSRERGRLGLKTTLRRVVLRSR